MIKKERISSIRDIGLMIQTMIKNRFNKDTKLIFTLGHYRSLYVSFYKQRVWQFYVKDHNGYYTIYLLKNDKVVRKEIIKRGELVSKFYTEIMHLFKMI